MIRSLQIGLSLILLVMFSACQQPVAVEEPNSAQQDNVDIQELPGIDSRSSGSSNPARGDRNAGQSSSATAALQKHASPAAMNTIPAAIKKGKLEFRVGEGEEVFSFKPKDGESCKLYNAAGEEQCKMTLVNGVLKVKTADDQPMFSLKPKDSKIMLLDASREKELFKFKLKGDTIDFYLPGDQRKYRVKKKDYGWRLEDNAGNTLFRAKSKGDKIVLRDLGEKTVLYSNDFANPLSLVFFRMSDLSPEQQAACAVYFMEK